MNITRIGVKNFRGFREQGSLDLKPINILVGKNSSGKSSLARLLPLFRQSFETKTKGPVLWFGPYVDFGSFYDSLTANSEDDSIHLFLDASLKAIKPSRMRIGRLRQRYSNFLLHDCLAKVEVRLSYSSEDQSTYTSGYSIDLCGNRMEAGFDRDGWLVSMTINGGPFNPTEDYVGIITGDDLIPNADIFRRTKNKESDEDDWEHVSSYGETMLVNYIRTHSHGGLAKQTIMKLVNVLGFGSDESLLVALRDFSTTSSYLNQFAKSMRPGSIKFKRLKQLYYLSYGYALVALINSKIREAFSGAKYIKPLRATAQRYYRYQELAVEIDSEGANIAMFLEGLSGRKRNSLNQWLMLKIGVAIHPVREGGHVALMVEEKSGNSFRNIADMGFGYSQVLPILVQAWYSSLEQEGPRSLSAVQDTSALIIEQPELHLHPDFQAKLADVFAEISALGKENGRRFPLIIETHSPHIVNRFGELISEEVLLSEDVNISLFEGDQGGAVVKRAYFNKEGYLENWPFGFFEPER